MVDRVTRTTLVAQLTAHLGDRSNITAEELRGVLTDYADTLTLGATEAALERRVTTLESFGPVGLALIHEVTASGSATWQASGTNMSELRSFFAVGTSARATVELVREAQLEAHLPDVGSRPSAGDAAAADDGYPLFRLGTGLAPDIWLGMDDAGAILVREGFAGADVIVSFFHLNVGGQHDSGGTTPVLTRYAATFANGSPSEADWLAGNTSEDALIWLPPNTGGQFEGFAIPADQPSPTEIQQVFGFINERFNFIPYLGQQDVIQDIGGTPYKTYITDRGHGRRAGAIQYRIRAI